MFEALVKFQQVCGHVLGYEPDLDPGPGVQMPR